VSSDLSGAVRRSLRRTVFTDVQQVPVRERKIVGRWLLGCAGMCFAAVSIGGITRYPIQFIYLCALFTAQFIVIFKLYFVK